MKTGSVKAFDWKKAVFPILLVVMLLFGGYLLFYKLGDRGIIAYDEARHGVNAYEMLQNKDWVVSTYQGEVDYYNLKPPLSNWAIMLGFELFGFNRFGFRVQAAFFVWVMLAVVALWTKKRHGSLVSLVSLAFLLANVVFYRTHSGRTSDADAAFLLFNAIGLMCMLDFPRNPRWLYGSALAFGFSFMAKGAHAAIIPVICLCYLIATGQLKKLTLKNYLLLILFGLLPILPWAIARYTRDGFAFFIRMFTTDVQKRMVTEQAGEELKNQWYFFLERVVTNPTAIIGVLLCALGLGSRLPSLRNPPARATGLVLWMVLPVVMFSFSVFKLHHYIFTSMIALSVACGLTVNHLLRHAQKGFLLTVCLLAVAVGLVFGMAENVRMINSEGDGGSYQNAMEEALDRSVDTGKHAYIQYDEAMDTWSQSDVLCAEMAGDLVCLNGGAAGFEEDAEPSLLIANKATFDFALLEYYGVYYETGYIYILEN